MSNQLHEKSGTQKDRNIMTRFHAGPQYTTEQQKELDALFGEWLELDAMADYRGYEDDARNAAADEKYAEYQLALEKIDRINASEEADNLVPIIRQGLRAQFSQREAVQ